MLWQILSALVDLYLVTFFTCVTIVFFSRDTLNKVTENNDEALAALTRILIAYMWPFALFNGDPGALS